MHRIILIARLLLSAVLLASSLSISSQETILLPAGKKLSFNGKFVPDIPDGYRQVSDNGVFKTQYEIGRVGDEVREINNFRLFENDQLCFVIQNLPGSDVMVSNSGVVAVFDTRFHFRNELTLHFYDKHGRSLRSETLQYASLFGFSPKGGFFCVGTGNGFLVIDLNAGNIYAFDRCNQFAFSPDESILATASEGIVNIFRHFEPAGQFQTDFFYPRGLAVSGHDNLISVCDKHTLITFTVYEQEVVYKHQLEGNKAYRDLIYSGNYLLAGIHEKQSGISEGVLQKTDRKGAIISEKVESEKRFRHFQDHNKEMHQKESYDSIPWPFIPFDQMHTVWNYYEQHMGNGVDTWSYLHQGLDLITPIDEPTYAVQAGWVKCVLTLGGDAYWRVAISPEQVVGYSDGWLYAHLVQGSIQVEVGDYVELHDYLGDIIYWSDDWGHIHFVEIRDQGLIWYYDDDEWGINFNPLLALTPNDDTIAPIIENFSVFSKFGFLTHGSNSDFQAPNNLSGNIDIIARISDFHHESPWELPAFETFYQFKKASDGAAVFPRTLGRKLNHTYSQYSSSFYQDYAPLIYFKDENHLPPAWMSESRNYYQVLSRNNGDTLISLEEINLSFATTDFYDDHYWLVVEAWDEVGNMSIDSQMVYFNNGIINNVHIPSLTSPGSYAFPNPANNELFIRFFVDDANSFGELRIMSPLTLHSENVEVGNVRQGWNTIRVDLQNYNTGVYFYSFGEQFTYSGKFVVAR
jgi:hypothetical protein